MGAGDREPYGIRTEPFVLGDGHERHHTAYSASIGKVSVSEMGATDHVIAQTSAEFATHFLL
jgi:hypothetical protein